MSKVILGSGEDGIRTHVPRRTSGFQGRLVMTASIPLLIYWHTGLPGTFRLNQRILMTVCQSHFRRTLPKASFSLRVGPRSGRKKTRFADLCRKSQRSDSNRQPADYKSAALPLSHTSKSFKKVGDLERARTVDLQRDRLAF